MNNGTYSYCLLQYHHSQLLGEVLNVGLFVYFPEAKRLEFLFPEKLIRLRLAYPNAPEKTIKSYFKYFQNRVGELNQNPEFFADNDLSTSLQTFLKNEFLPADSSALQLGNFRTSVLYTTNLEHIRNQLYNLYFSVFQVQENASKRVDEIVLLHRYKSLLREYSKETSLESETSTLFFDYSIQPNDASTIKFDVAWKSGNSLHLVKPVSFDLVRSERITQKAYQYSGQFLDLETYAVKNNAQFDVILAKPKARPLFKAYDNAIRILHRPERVKIIEQDKLDEYSKVTASEAAL
jgi:hypothetical protein